MKIRNDYVSNSSSSSFVVKDNAVNAARMFYDDYKDSMNEVEPLGETMRIYVKCKGDSDWSSTYLEDFCKEVEEGEKTFDDIVELSFDCDDWDSTGCMYLNFLYLYFQKFGFNPDDTNTEHPFRNDDRNSNHFLSRILKRLDFYPPKEDNKKDSEK